MFKAIFFKYKIYFLLAISCMFIYWVLMLGFYSPKNDNIIYFLSSRFNISRSIQDWKIPFWSSNIYMGIPLHSDMQSGFWNPLVWVFSFFGTYNIHTLVAETFCYIFIAAFGIFKLSKLYKNNNIFSFVIAITYISCGFFTDVIGQNIEFLIGACYLPIIFYCIINYYKYFSLKYFFATAFSIYLLVSSSYPSFTIISIYILLAFTLFKFFSLKNKNEKIIFFKNILLLLIFVLIVFSPIIYSYYEFLSYYNRGAGNLPYNVVAGNSYNPKTLISLFYPFVITNKFTNYNTDAIMRNCFLGLFIVLPFFVRKSSIKNNLILVSGFLFLFISFGDFSFFHKIVYKLIPLFNSFRHPANFRLYFIFFFLFYCIRVNKSEMVFNKKMINGFSLIFVVLLLSQILFNYFSNSTQNHFVDDIIKNPLFFFENITFDRAMVIQSIFYIGIILLSFFVKKKFKFYFIQLAILFCFAQLQIFKLVVSKQKPIHINEIINQFKNEKVDYYHKTLYELSLNDMNTFKEIGVASYYKKYPTLSLQQTGPTINKYYLNFINSDSGIQKIFASKIVRLNNNYQTDSSEIIKINKLNFDANTIEIDVNSKVDTSILIHQNYHHNWSLTNNGEKEAINFAPISHFIILKVFRGENKIKLIYKPKVVIYIFSISILLIILFILFLKRKK